jgi:hypothetical protein
VGKARSKITLPATKSADIQPSYAPVKEEGFPFFLVGIAMVALKSQINDEHVMFALCGTLGIGEGPGASGAAKSVFCGCMFPH